MLVGFSGGAAFAGGLLLAEPDRYAGTAILYGALPFDAGVPTSPDRLEGARVLVVHGDQDMVIPRELLDRTWSYLTGDAAALTTAVRDAGGHGLSTGVLAEVQQWLGTTLTDVATSRR